VKYFILCGLLPEVGPAGHRISFGGHIPSGRADRLRFWSDWPATGPLPQEGERLVVRCSSLGRMSVFVHDVFSAHFLVVARSQENAYRIAAPFRAFATVYLGWAMEEAEIEYLVELSRKPDPEDSTESMALSHVGSGGYEPDDALVAQHLETGWVLATEQIAAASSFLDSVLQSDRHVLALRYLERSHYLLSGFMSSSYYHFHYSRDRVSQTPYWRRKMYLERSSVYDLSFLSAFRALEALLGCGARSLEGRQILPGLLSLDHEFGTNLATEIWESFHHVFTARRRLWSYGELIQQFLDTRNAVAAHANPSPPFPLYEDQVFELQRLVASMLRETALSEGGRDKSCRAQR
jgi:hypothetical protein